ncbi:hypothetical protein HPB52_002161 [Rhipicephalus sanguineus]|uniref:EB domain-containing protein n=1 Tax=Rhipicephalus sanguineus TaxID=34632 RepID=A0A9D4T504_RHISA|nr:hypothetical protein HPB52_002161 [Rhipicephalus sanguineus]
MGMLRANFKAIRAGASKFGKRASLAMTRRKLGDPCRSDAQCEAGSNASACRGSSCRCKDGYYQESIGGNSTCVPGNPPLLLCYTNYDCFIRDRHLVCDGRFCRCRQGYHTELTAWGWRCAGNDARSPTRDKGCMIARLGAVPIGTSSHSAVESLFVRWLSEARVRGQETHLTTSCHPQRPAVCHLNHHLTIQLKR